jgi:hypothetical protein
LSGDGPARQRTGWRSSILRIQGEAEKGRPTLLRKRQVPAKAKSTAVSMTIMGRACRQSGCDAINHPAGRRDGPERRAIGEAQAAPPRCGRYAGPKGYVLTRLGGSVPRLTQTKYGYAMTYEITKEERDILVVTLEKLRSYREHEAQAEKSLVGSRMSDDADYFIERFSRIINRMQ